MIQQAEVAQLVEQPIRNRQVGSSSLPLGSTNLQRNRRNRFHHSLVAAADLNIISLFGLGVASKETKTPSAFCRIETEYVFPITKLGQKSGGTFPSSSVQDSVYQILPARACTSMPRETIPLSDAEKVSRTSSIRNRCTPLNGFFCAFAIPQTPNNAIATTIVILI